MNKVLINRYNVYVPRAVEEMKNGLRCVKFITVACDTSNHNHVK
jgi:hypothetical protein